MNTPDAGAEQPVPPRRILVVDDDPHLRSFYSITLEQEGWEVVEAADGEEGLRALKQHDIQLVVSDVMMPNVDGLAFLKGVREDPLLRATPVILLTTLGETHRVIQGLSLGADDYLVKPIDAAELIARVRAKLERPPVPADQVTRDVRTGFLNDRTFLEEARREITRASRGGRPGCIAVVDLYEGARLRENFGFRGDAALARQVSGVIGGFLQPLDVLGRSSDGAFLLLMPETDPVTAHQRLYDLARQISAHAFDAAGAPVRPTPVIGFASFPAGADSPGMDAPGIVRRARAARTRALRDLNLHPVAWETEIGEAGKGSEGDRPGSAPKGKGARWSALRLGGQVFATYLVAILLPFAFYLALGKAGPPVARGVYLVVVAALLLTCSLIWIEGFKALKRLDPPAEPAQPYPPASAIIAAYLPNEAATIESTIEAFLRLDYPAELEVILAYNTPQDHPIEDVLRTIALAEPRLRLLRVEGSESKAQNVNAALSEVRGEFVGIFDADHHPDPDNFRRAWRWISHGWEVVQGHCLARNGDASWISRIIAVEFEQIYAVSHPGRERLHGFGIFGGSNGYWRTSLLKKTRMHGFMLTEDIDSSLRVIGSGGKILSDPYLVSRELAPTTVKSLWNQRLRWAQGWFQVSMEHYRIALRSPDLRFGQRLGLLYLLLWREVFPWIALQVMPIVLYWAVQLGGFDKIDWWVPIFVATTLFTLGTGPGQVAFTWKLADPQIKKHGWWFWWYILASILFYTGLKNLIARVAQVKELMRERDWRVTPRS